MIDYHHTWASIGSAHPSPVWIDLALIVGSVRWWNKVSDHKHDNGRVAADRAAACMPLLHECSERAEACVAAVSHRVLRSESKDGLENQKWHTGYGRGYF